MKEKQTLMDGNTAAAWGARLSRVQVIPCFPITPQTEIIEAIAQWKADEEWNGEFLKMDSEHSVLSAAVASEATGARTFTASSSQGTMLMREIFNIASGMRLPIVMVNCSRALSAPVSLWPDHNDFLALRDSGWLMLFAKNNQEVLDSIIHAYKIAEDRDVLLPFLVNMEGYILSYTREPVYLPEQREVDAFLPAFEPKVLLDVKKPMSLGVPVMKEYMYFRSQLHKAQLNALDVIKKVCNEFEKEFGRKYGLIEEYKTEGAETVFVACGSLCTTIQEAVDSLERTGLLRLRCYRPFPSNEIKNALKDCEKIIVIDNNVAPGSGGIIYPEICAVAEKEKIYSAVVGLGGKPIGKKDFEELAKKISKEKNKKFWLL